MNAKVFINYRREDTAPYAGRLYDRLTAHFGEDQVFIDIDQIEPGEDFVEAINRKVGTCDIAIVAIGPHWLGATDASGKRRLDDEEDFVRMEIVAALQRKIRVIPILVGGARMPRKQDLPEVLAPLSRRNAIEVSETRFHADVNRLIEAIEKSFIVAENKVELSAKPAAPPPEPAAVRSLEPESKVFPESSGPTKPVEAAELKEVDGETVSGAVPVSLGETTEQFPTQAAPPYWDSEKSHKDSVADANDLTTSVKSTQTTPATSPVPSTSSIAALKEPKVWTRKRLIIVAAVGATVILLLAITKSGVFTQAEKKPTPLPETVTLQNSPAPPPQPRASESPSDSWNTLVNEIKSRYAPRTAETPAETPSSQSESTGGYDPAMATVDMQRIFKEYNQTKDAEAKINDAKNAAKKEYDDRAEAYKKALDEINNLNKQLESPALSADQKTQTAKERDSKIANIKNMEREIRDWRDTRERQLQEQLMRMREGIVKEITGKLGELGGGVADIIFDRSGVSLNGVPVLMYSPDRGDMSGKVIGALNNGSPSTFTTIRNLKVAVIDMQSAFKNYNKTKDAEAKINDAKNAAKKEYDDRAEAYKKALDEINNLNKQLESPALSADQKTQTAKERDSKIANIKNMEREIGDFRQTRERQLQEQLMRIREGIVKEITDVVMNAVKANNIGIVLDISGMSINGVPFVIYRHGIPDFTGATIAKLNGTSFSGTMLASSDSSRTLRLGVVDMHRAFEAWPEAKTIEAKINDEKAAAKKNYASQSSAEREKGDKQIEEEAKKLREPIIAKIAATVNTCAERAGFNLVFDSSGKSINGVPVVLFVRDLPDLTDAILKEHD